MTPANGGNLTVPLTDSRPFSACSVSIEVLKRELSALNASEQRHLAAFLVSLQDAGDAAYRQKLSAKIDKPASEFATLEELHRRLKLPEDSSRP